MANFASLIEVLENQVMRAWMSRNASEIKSLVSGDCLMMFGTNPPVLLDRASFVAAIPDQLTLRGFRFHEVTAQRHGGSAWFTGHVELEMTVDGKDWKEPFLISDLWRKTTLRRQWVLAERSLAPLKQDSSLSTSIRKLQLWR